MSVEKYFINELNPDIIRPTTEMFQKDPAGALEVGGHKIAVIGKPGCFARGTQVMMYDGSIQTVENVKPGEKVMGTDSTPRTVLELCRGEELMFKISLEFGEPIVVNKNHILSLKHEGKIVDLTVAEFLTRSESFRNSCKWFRVGIENFPYSKSEPINFYKFGKTCKTIPHEYKTASYKHRIQLVSGIVDKHGVYDEDDLCYKLLCPLNLIADLLFVARSLGIASYESNGLVYLFGNVHQLELNKLKKAPEIENEYLEMNFSLTPVGVHPYYGFTLDGDHRFLLEDFSVVHNTGKSTLIASLLYSKKHIIPVGIVFSGTEDTNKFYQKMFPNTFVFNKYDEEQIKSFIDRQKNAREYLENPWAVIIIDDCTDKPTIFRQELQNAMYKKGRHWNMLYILALQYCMDIPNNIRTNTDGVFILREPNINNRKRLFDNYAGVIGDFKLFCKLMDALTDDFTALYIHNDSKANTWQDCVFWYKAKKVPEDFRFGSADYWQFHFERYNEEYVDKLKF